jgi:hypothetical protein
MRRRVFASLTAVGITLAAVALLPASTTAQSPAAKGQAAAKVGRTPDGQPDLQGVWTFATATPLERPKELADRAFLTEKEVAEFEKQVVTRQDVDNREGTEGTEGDVGRAYNQFWWDRGTKVVGSRRTSLVVDPPDGKVPAMTPEGAKRMEVFARRVSDGPETRSLWERCITHSSLPRMSTGYNNNLQIIQGAGYVVILYEMIHEARVIPLDGRAHVDSSIRQWLGDSRGHWEGETLVVDVTNFSDKTSFRGSSPDLHLVERFTRADANTLNYEFTVSDPSTWAKPWTAAVPMPRVNGLIYEYACHEGNYGLPGQLSGARADERNAADAAKKGSR